MSRNAGPSLDSFKQVSENGKGNWEAGKADSAGDSLLKQTRAAHILSHVAAFQKAKYREKFQLFDYTTHFSTSPNPVLSSLVFLMKE